MATATYQDVLCRMVASALYRDWLLTHPEEALDGLDLTGRERRRLLAVATQPGMRVSTAIHRANRLGPLDQALPLTCALLGEALGAVLERYWMARVIETVQVAAEAEAFAQHLEREAAAGRLAVQHLPDVLNFERAVMALRFAAGGARDEGAGARIRIVHFSHDPVALLGALAGRTPVPPDLPAGDFYVAIDRRSEEPEFRLLDVEAVAACRALGVVGA